MRFAQRIAGHVAVLEADPELGSEIDVSELDEARRRAIAPQALIDPPGWDPSEFRALHGSVWLGLLLVDGLMLRCVTVGRRTACELFGPGDVIRPWDADGDYYPLPIALEWRVLEPTELALLNDLFAVRISPWPSISAQLLSRVARRARHLALTHAITALPRIHARLLILFWVLAERWGRVGVDGVRIHLPLTHDVLAMLVGAQRPSVTVAIHRLEEADLLKRPSHHQWLLTQQAIDRLAEPATLEPLGLVHESPESS